MESSVGVPVGFFIFNRPQHTARVFEAIARARPPRLFVVADGPRPANPDDERLVQETRAVVERIDWPCELLTSYSEVNLGCGRRIASGLDWIFSNVPEAILLEDDCLPEASFFRYCQELLEHWRDDERVHLISGSNVSGKGGSYSYYFSRCYHIWGWASWARAWNHYDYEMRAWPALRTTRWVEEHVPDEGAAEMARAMFDGTYSGEIRQWDFQLAFSGWQQNAASAIPTVNLVTNIGYGDQATHQVDRDHPFAEVPVEPMGFPLRHPPDVEIFEQADRAVWDRLLQRPPLQPRTRGKRWVDAARRMRGGLPRTAR